MSGVDHSERSNVVIVLLVLSGLGKAFFCLSSLRKQASERTELGGTSLLSANLSFFVWQCQYLNAGLALADCSTIWAMPPPLCWLSLFWIYRAWLFCPGHPGSQSSYFTPPAIAEVTGMPPCPAVFHWDRVSKTFSPRLSWNHDPPNLSLPSSYNYRCKS
jgi:hypothetical protein